MKDEDDQEFWDLDILRSRHDSRARAVQVLYAIEIGEHTLSNAMDDLIKGGDQKYVEFAHRLVMLAHRHQSKLDGMIEEKAKHWKLSRIAILDRITLRVAVSELLYVKDVPPKVTINEAIEIGKDFSTEQSGRFINGILDAIYNEREAEIRRIKTPDATSKSYQKKPKGKSPGGTDAGRTKRGKKQ